MNDKKQKKSFIKSHPILMNIVYIIATGLVLCWLGLVFLDFWTDHGDERTVPDVKGRTFAQAEIILKQSDLSVEVSDSIYDTKLAPGTVIEQSPHMGAKVKPGRTVYLTIVAFAAKMVTVPDISNVSGRQAQSIFEGLGIKHIRIVEVESQYEGLLLCAKFNGLPLSAGARIPVTATITLEVGQGYSGSQLDSMALDSIIIEPINDELNLE